MSRHPRRISGEYLDLTRNSLGGFIETVCELRTQLIGRGEYFEPWFRGQSDPRWPLTPTFYRLVFGVSEWELRRQFTKRGVQLAGLREPRDPWEWYFLMQHFGAPTRLLDWTDSALVALFFAINSYVPGRDAVEHDATVWVLDPNWLNQLSIGERGVLSPDDARLHPYLPEQDTAIRKSLPVAIDPPHISPRVAVQRSRFTVHGRSRDAFAQLGKRRGARLVHVRIPASSIRSMRSDLATCGVTDSTIFPDLEHLGREISRYYSDDLEDP
jgi:hypothetical protein